MSTKPVLQVGDVGPTGRPLPFLPDPPPLDRHGPARILDGVTLAWLREVRAGNRAFEPDEVHRRVRALARARLDYESLLISWTPGGFSYAPQRSGTSS